MKKSFNFGKFQGFTLAEVLITLGIIGVVAAMTIPNLIANTNGAKFRSQFKKSVSTLNQAALMAQAQYEFDFGGATEACAQADSSGDSSSADNPETTLSMCALFNGTLTGQTYLGKVSDIDLKGKSTSSSMLELPAYADQSTTSSKYEIKNIGSGALPTTYTSYIAYSLADGSIVAFADHGGTDATDCSLDLGEIIDNSWITKHANCLGFIDVNGTTLPNKEVTCGSGATDPSSANKATANPQSPCEVPNDSKHMTDVFPVLFHDATVEAASDAAKYILTTSK